MKIPILNSDEVITLNKNFGFLFFDPTEKRLKIKINESFVYFQGLSNDESNDPDTPESPETPNYGEGALIVSGFTDYNNEVMQLSYPFSNFNGIYRKNSDTSYEKIYDLNNNPVSTPYFILMDTNNNYWCLCESSTISHYHSSIAYHDDHSGVMPPTTENGITWFYSGGYDADLRNFTIEEI